MRWDDDDLTQTDPPERPAVIHRTGDGVILPGDRATFVLDRSGETQPARSHVVRRDPNLLLEHDAFATQLARQRRWLVTLTVAVALLIPPAAVVYGAAIAILRAILQGAW